MALKRKIVGFLSTYIWCGFFFLLGGVLVSTLAFNVMGRAIGFEKIQIVTLIPGFLVGSLAGLAISFLVIRNRRSLLNRLASEQTLTERLRTEIAERKNTENALRGSEAQLRLVTDNIPALVAYVDRDLIIRFCNRPYAESSSLVPGDVVGRPLKEIRGRRTFEENLPDIERTLAGETTSYEGTRELVGGEKRYFRAIRVPHFGNDGAVLGYFNIGFDLTEYRAREEQLHQAQKMDAVGQMTGGVAHDFNNILTVILGNLEFLNENAKTEDDKDLIAGSMAAAKRAAELTHHLLAFSRKQQLEPQLLDIDEHVQRMVNLLRRTLGEGITLRTIRKAKLWKCVADPAQLESAIMNLCLNARDAMPSGGELMIECWNASLENAAEFKLPQVTAGDYVVVSIADTGHGMPPEVLAHALEPFFTTKEVGHGSGLGLAMIYGFVQQSGGGVAIESEVDQGTTVRLYLPRAAEGDQAPQEVEESGLSRGGKETVLVIEDDLDVRKLTVHMLKGLGYTVIDAATADAAREVLERENRIDLVLSDVVLPGGTSGPQFADQVKTIRPDLGFIFMSGYSPETAMGNGFHSHGSRLLRKPFQRQQLAAAVREALDGKPAQGSH